MTALLFLVWAGCTGLSDPIPDVSDRDRLWNLITTGNADQDQPTGELPAEPWYRSWGLMPVFDGEPPFELLPLDLPTHGRYVTVYTNDVARDYLTGYLADVLAAGGDIPLADLPVGAILVKENVPETLPDLAPAAEPAVLTVAYKPSDDFCDSGDRYDGASCVGGNWMWAFYGLNQGDLERSGFDAAVQANTTSFCVNCHDPGVRTDYLRGLQRMVRRKAATLRPTRDPREPGPWGPYGDDAFCASLQIGPDWPVDVAFDPTTIESPEQRQRMFDCFAWRSFVALSWPAAGSSRGAPDPKATSLADAPDADRVWETYTATWELFQPDDPSWDPTQSGLTFDTPRPVPAPCQGVTDEPLPVVAMISKSSHSRDVANETGQAFAGTFGSLTDRNGALVRYQVLFNEAEFDTLLPTAATRALTPAGPDQGAGVFLPDGSTEVKASWKQLCSSDGCAPVDDPADYYTRSVLAYDAHGGGNGQPTCTVETFGLVGLHVARKTFWAPQWIWATFEHRLNAPDDASAGPDTEGYSFYDPSCQPQPYTFGFAECAVQPFLAPNGLADPCCRNAELNRFEGPAGFGDHANQVTRLAPIGPTGLNAEYAKALSGTVWDHYFLVDTQWPMNGRRGSTEGYAVNTQLCEDQWDLAHDPAVVPVPESACYTMVPSVLRNTSMESYMATWTDPQTQVSNRSCMGCHDSGTDFTFIWLDAVEQVVPVP